MSTNDNRKTRNPAIPHTNDAFGQAVKEALEVGMGQRGKPLDRFVRLRELRDAGLVVVSDGGGSGGSAIIGVGPGAGGGSTGPIEPDPDGPPDFGTGDRTPPPAPTGVRARGLNLNTIGVTWNAPQYVNHAYAEVFASLADNWSEIRATFNPSLPIGAGNSTQYFMGTASGTTFLHSGLEGTVPSLNYERVILDIFDPPGDGVTIRLNVIAGTFVAPGDRVFLTTQGSAWGSNGQQGTVQSVNDVDMTVVMDGGDSAVVYPIADDAIVVKLVDEDELDEELEPQPIYYWVRFISTAGVPGPVQSDAGVPGTVMLNPEQILNILTGRIRASNLATEIITPINWISGPLNDFPSVGAFVNSLGEDLINAFDADLWSFFIGDATPGSETGGAALSQVKGFVDATGGFIEALETIQLGGQWTPDDPDSPTPFGELIATIAGRRLVELTDEAALAYIGSTLQIAIGDPDDPDFVLLNQVAQQVFVNEQSINNSITLKVQANIGGVLTSAGFGIGLQTDPDDPDNLISTFAVAADQFAIMSAANNGRVATSIAYLGDAGDGNPGYRLNLSGDPGADGLNTNERVAVTFPPNAPANVRTALQGRTFRIVSRSGNPGSIRVEAADGQSVVPVSTSLGPQYAVFPEQNIPFVVDTGSSTVGIRGRLVVNGLISADEIEVNDLLRANEIWATSLTAFGLIRSPLLVGEVITTPLFGGWGVKIAMEDTGFDNRVIEFSRWGEGTQTPPVDPDDISGLSDPNQYPQIANAEPDDTSFYLRASDGSVYVRGNLTVGGNARFWTGYNGAPSTHFIQMDQQFPLFIIDRAAAAAAGIPLGEGEGYTYTQTMIDRIQRDALMWANSNGTVGFNTLNGAIFVDDTPLDSPSGSGFVSVKTRLDFGAPTGRGRVLITGTFELAVNRFNNNGDRVGCTIAVYAAPADGSYTSPGNIELPSQRGSMQRPGGPPTQTPENPGYLDAHFIILRGDGALSSWENANNLGGFKAHELFRASEPGGHPISASVELPSSDNYKILVVINERFAENGNPLDPNYGPGGGETQAAVNVWNASLFVQQVSNTQYTGQRTSADGTPVELADVQPAPDGYQSGAIEA